MDANEIAAALNFDPQFRYCRQHGCKAAVNINRTQGIVHIIHLGEKTTYHINLLATGDKPTVLRNISEFFDRHHMKEVERSLEQEDEFDGMSVQELVSEIYKLRHKIDYITKG